MHDKRVLVVEDNSDLRRRMIEFLIIQAGIAIVGEASNGAEALDFLAKNEVDIILLDIIMPQMDGFTMMEKMCHTDICPRAKVIVVSSLARKDFIKRAYELGAYGYITKPYRPDELLFHIRKVDTQREDVL